MANYTPEETKKLLDLYAELGSSKIDEIAKEMGKSVRSIRAKLSREKKDDGSSVYVAPEKPVKAKDDGPRKKELVQKLVELTGKQLTGIDPATKGALQELIEAFTERQVS